MLKYFVAGCLMCTAFISAQTPTDKDPSTAPQCSDIQYCPCGCNCHNNCKCGCKDGKPCHCK